MRWAVLAALLLAGCAYKSELVSGNADGVTIAAGRYANPGPEATAHCAKFSKDAVMTKQDGKFIEFRCAAR